MSKLCLAPWVSTYIYPDGGVSPCCDSQVNGKVYTCGSLHENTLSEIWAQPGVAMRKFHDDHLSSKL